MKLIARAIVGVLLIASMPAHAGRAFSQREALTQQMVHELASSQYQERAENPTLAVQEQGHNAVILKQRGTGACANGWRDAVHQSAWFGKLAKCWRLASAERVEVCPIAAGRVGKQSCFELRKAVFTTQGRSWLPDSDR